MFRMGKYDMVQHSHFVALDIMVTVCIAVAAC